MCLARSGHMQNHWYELLSSPTFRMGSHGHLGEGSGEIRREQMRFGMHRERLGEKDAIRERSGEIGREEDAIRERSGEIGRKKHDSGEIGGDWERKCDSGCIGSEWEKQNMRFGRDRERWGEKRCDSGEIG